MKRTLLAPRGHCPQHELRFAITTSDGRYLASKDVPFQWDANIDKALLWERRREAEAFPVPMFGRRYSVVQVREETLR